MHLSKLYVYSVYVSSATCTNGCGWTLQIQTHHLESAQHITGNNLHSNEYLMVHDRVFSKPLLPTKFNKSSIERVVTFHHSHRSKIYTALATFEVIWKGTSETIKHCFFRKKCNAQHMNVFRIFEENGKTSLAPLSVGMMWWKSCNELVFISSGVPAFIFLYFFNISTRRIPLQQAPII